MLRVQPPSALGGNFPAADHDRAIDLVHLARMTLGDRDLEREVLQLFVRQASLLLERMDGADAETVATLAHTMKGSAQGLGAWRVAGAADAVEHALPDAIGDAMPVLRAAVAQAQSVIADLLRAH